MAKKSVAKPAPIQAPAPVNGPDASACADALHAQIEGNLDTTRDAFQAAEHSSANGPFENYVVASEAFNLRPEWLLAWVRPSKGTKAEDIGAMELAIRMEHNRTAPDSSPEWKEYMRELRNFAAQASPSEIVRQVQEDLGRKNFPANANATDDSMALARKALDERMEQARATGENARCDIVGKFIDAIGDRDKLATLDRLYNAVETRNGLWRSSLFLKFIANDIREACRDFSLTPGLVWEKATKAAAAVHKSANAKKLTTGEAIVSAMRAAARAHVKSFQDKRLEPTKQDDGEKIAAAKQLVFKNLRALHSFNELDASQYESLVNFFKDSLQWKDEEQAKKDAKDAEKQLKEAQTRIAKELAAEEKKQRERALARGKGKVVPIKGKGLVFRAPAPNQASETKPATVAAKVAAKKQGKVAKGPKVEATEAAAPVTPAPVPDVMQALEENNASA